MGMNITEKIIRKHLVDGEMIPGKEIAIRIDQTLTQDATGTMAYLQFESMGIDRVRTKKSVAYIDHNTLQTGFENADDHRYIQSCAAKYGLYFSRPGNGICHQVHLERFARPGDTLLGSDSHTPTAGGLGMLAIGAGGLDVAVAMGGGAFRLNMPEVINVRLSGELPPMVSAKDVILKVLELLTVKGGVGKVIEYSGNIAALTVPERATITNMGAELGATTSVFPTDSESRKFLTAQKRYADYMPLQADPDAQYSRIIDLNLSELRPLVACPHSPDNVKPVAELKGTKIDQVCIGSCTNSSYLDLMKVAKILKGKTVAEHVSLVIAPGSKQVLDMLAKNGALSDIIGAGARVLECACGPCIGMGQAPNSAGVSLRTFNRNFKGRSGTADGQIYLVSPETAAVSALAGVLTDPTDVPQDLSVELPEIYDINDNMILPPCDGKDVTVQYGPNIKPFPLNQPLPETVSCRAVLKVGDNITTDHIMPAGAKILPYRSNIPYLSQFCFAVCDPDFAVRAKEWGGGIVIGGENYGQGSSREHAALVPLYLGVKAVVAKSFARIHAANLINSGILPLVFADPSDYDRIEQGDDLVLEDVRAGVEAGKTLVLFDKTKDVRILLNNTFTDRQKKMILAGGLLNAIREGIL